MPLKAATIANIKARAFADAMGEVESPELRDDNHCREWYQALKELRAGAERKNLDLKQEKTRLEAAWKAAASSRERYEIKEELAAVDSERDGVGHELFCLNASLGTAKETVKALNKATNHNPPTPAANVPDPLPPPPPPESGSEALLRGDLRASQRMMRRCFDFLVSDQYITFRGQDAREGLLKDLQNELRGT